MRRLIAASVARRIALKKMGVGALALAAPMQVLAAVADAGKPVTRARRLISVGGALTEIVYALDAQADLVGVDTTSLFPATAQKLPQVGYARTLSSEGLLSLAPTQLIATEEAGPPTVLRQVRDAGVSVSVLNANNKFEGVLERVKQVGQLTGRVEPAARLSQTLQKQWDGALASVQQRRQSSAHAPVRVLFILAHAPNQVMVGGRETGADAMLAYAGAVNVMGGQAGFAGYKPLTPEAVIAARPDVVLVTDQGLKASGGVEGILKLPGLEQTPAGRKHRIVSLEAMLLLGFGPRMPQALTELDAAFAKAMAA
ncbi:MULTISPECIES: hemin ABC transporter substrate-binding protein [unclassified Janthinobacterium]|uniref:heme/hemin ABC transporter substrate-binding protein n=1 Tax=unclassified Janthinobacterium TaxID=2610881 RepID=UPI00161B1BE6|nr:MULTISPECIES: ABC transporter substrate-binding protein [unclassified Janthinobacterium]MBB5369425.1 iron complex transport system substrate-binding protein [Janthinobacterium sp. K2C7]MBB5381039.1 iron complex transport system substrate-binding protein [Janthinobacterium sp. K2Li3]MBB5387808.1 iron complex transport system substrate-binding protein [Janthinobacterium sp. K2E3]